MMSKAIRIHAVGGPEVMKWEQVPTPQPGPAEALIHHEAVGLNYIDVYFRTGLYKTQLPAILGMEGAGVVVAVGDEVQNVSPGDRVAYALSLIHILPMTKMKTRPMRKLTSVKSDRVRKGLGASADCTAKM